MRVWKIIPFLLACACIRTSSATADIASICAVVQNGTSVRDPNSCDKWYICQDGLVVEENQCANGEYYNKDAKACQPSAPGKCILDSGNQCEGQTNGTFVADPLSCSTYYYCRNQVAQRGECSTNFYFDPSKHDCVKSTEYTCSDQTLALASLCRVVPNGKYFGDANECATWHICSNGKPTTGQCPSDYYYHSMDGVCDYLVNGVCDTTPNPDGPIIEGVCTDAGTYQSDAKTCSGFYYCYDNGASGLYNMRGKCADAKYFDASTGKCGERANVVCPYDRCESFNLEWSNIPGSGCLGYLVCRNGTTVARQKCPERTPYFDEVKQVCTSRVITYPFCV